MCCLEVVFLVVKLCFCLNVAWVLRGAWEFSIPAVTRFLFPWGSCRKGKGVVCLRAGFGRSPRERVGLEQHRAGSSWASELSPVTVSSTTRVCCSSSINLQLSCWTCWDFSSLERAPLRWLTSLPLPCEIGKLVWPLWEARKQQPKQSYSEVSA